jgi:hypothetical protein
MTAIKGIIHNGQVVLASPANLPDGTEVTVLPLSPNPSEDESPLAPEEIVRLLALMDQVQPFDMTTQEHAAIESERRSRKDWEKKHFNDHADKLRSQWP